MCRSAASMPWQRPRAGAAHGATWVPCWAVPPPPARAAWRLPASCARCWSRPRRASQKDPFSRTSCHTPPPGSAAAMHSPSRLPLVCPSRRHLARNPCTTSSRDSFSRFWVRPWRSLRSRRRQQGSRGAASRRPTPTRRRRWAGPRRPFARAWPSRASPCSRPCRRLSPCSGRTSCTPWTSPAASWPTRTRSSCRTPSPCCRPSMRVQCSASCRPGSAWGA
mmetsp:Transcript_88767/g.264827  ORF Transcript_88767/g.264827 Transcript_88767/m.264827 type:complete len:221 (+) Transcript_88767:2163-2825(+)